MAFTVLIPARLASTRLPDKPLADIAGLPMIVRVAQQAARSKAQRVVVAADDEAIVDACERHDVQVVLTRADHPSGSDRLAEACQLLALHDGEIVVNVQGDEPLIDPALVDAVAALLDAKREAQMSTAAHRIDDPADVANTNVVKVVLDAQGMALYFSRATIPWSRDAFASGIRGLPPTPLLRHVGIYAYRVGFLKRFPQMPQAPIETAEALEQLRALWHGHRIAVHVTQTAPGIGVDTPADLERVRAVFAGKTPRFP
jgi:3-deoxy-manno-octulosonate cytidylyltransferase (CMP-KDO synthetase)